MTRTFRRHPRVVVRDEGEGAIALHLDTQQYFELNGSARTVWEALDDGTTSADLVEHLVRTYDIDHDTALEVVEELLAQLVREQMVEIQGERRRDRLRRRILGH